MQRQWQILTIFFLAFAQVAKASTVDLIYLGHAAFLGKTSNHTVFVIDPWLKNPSYPSAYTLPEKIDALLLTHGHFDHVGQAKELAATTKALVVGSYELIESLQLPAAQNSGINPGGAVVINDITIYATQAIHSSGMGGMAMGYVIKVKNGPSFYHAGDTDVFGDMRLIGERYHPQTALLPIGGHFTMDPHGAAMAATLLGVRQVIPMHYGTFAALTGTPTQLRQALRKDITIQTPIPGTPIHLLP